MQVMVNVHLTALTKLVHATECDYDNCYRQLLTYYNKDLSTHYALQRLPDLQTIVLLGMQASK